MKKYYREVVSGTFSGSPFCESYPQDKSSEVLRNVDTVVQDSDSGYTVPLSTVNIRDTPINETMYIVLCMDVCVLLRLGNWYMPCFA